jgi:hypothetical protein
MCKVGEQLYLYYRLLLGVEMCSISAIFLKGTRLQTITNNVCKKMKLKRAYGMKKSLKITKR